MAQDTTPAIVIYEGDGSTNVFSIPFDQGHYGEVKVAFVRRGLTNYEYAPDTFIPGATLYAWTNSEESATVYTKTPTPYVPGEEEYDPEYTPIYDEYGNETINVVTEYENNTIETNGSELIYTRDADSDILQHQYLTWTGDTLNAGDYICIVRETERSQPFVFPNNQKHIEDALDNLERQIQELDYITDTALIVDPIENSMSPIDWLETIVRCTDLSVRELRYYNGWLQYSLTDPKASSEEKTWYNLLNTTNIKSLYYRYTEDDEGRPLYNVYYKDNNGVEHLLSYDADTQRLDIEELKRKTEQNRQSIDAEKIVRRQADDELRGLIESATYDVTQFDSRITQNTNNITALDNRLDSTVTDSDKAMPKSYIDGLVSGIYHIKGIKETISELPTEGNVVGDCWNVLEDGKTYIWTEDEEWVSGAASVDLTPYRKAEDQDVIDAGKQDKLTEGTYIEITNNNTINMTGKFGKSFSMDGKNLQLKDQDGSVLSETLVSVGVDAEYTAATEDVSFADGEAGDYTFIQEQIDAINGMIPDNATSSNKLATAGDIGTGILTLQKNGTTIDTFSANSSENKTISVTVPTTASDVNALPDTTKYGSSIDLSINSSTYVVTAQLKDQNGANLGAAKTIDLPLESVVVSGSYNSEAKKIVLTLQDGSTIDIPVGDLISGLQTEITSASPLDADLVSDTNSTHKFVLASDKTTWNGKQDALVSGTNIKTINSTSILGSGNIDIDGLPAQADKNGKYLKTDGTTASWEDVDGLPAQAGNNGKFLTTDGSAASWATVNALPDQSSQGGKYLKTDGSVASWEEIPVAEKYIAGDNITIAGVLPDGYTLVEYIESDGTDYIDTGKKWDSNSVIVVKAKGINTTSGSRCIAGAVADGSGFQVVTELNRIGWQIGGAGYTHTSANVADEVRIDVPNHSAYFNGTLISDSYNTTTANINVFLFANNYGGSATSNSHVRVFRYTCYSRYNLPVIDLVPCKNSSNVYGFYDLESDTFFTCNGLTGGDAGRIISAKVPEVGNGTITIKQGNVNKGSFRMNQSNNATINLDANVSSVNTKTGDVVLTAADVSAVPQVTALNFAGADDVGKIVQFVGPTDAYTNGYFYKGTATYTDATQIIQSGSQQLVVHTDIATFLNSGLELNTPYLYKKVGAYWECIDPAGVSILGPAAGLVAEGVVNANDQVQVEVDVVYTWERIDVQPDAGVTATYDASTKTITFA